MVYTIFQSIYQHDFILINSYQLVYQILLHVSQIRNYRKLISNIN